MCKMMSSYTQGGAHSLSRAAKLSQGSLNARTIICGGFHQRLKYFYRMLDCLKVFINTLDSSKAMHERLAEQNILASKETTYYRLRKSYKRQSEEEN